MCWNLLQIQLFVNILVSNWYITWGMLCSIYLYLIISHMYWILFFFSIFWGLRTTSRQFQQRDDVRCSPEIEESEETASLPINHFIYISFCFCCLGIDKFVSDKYILVKCPISAKILIIIFVNLKQIKYNIM